MKKSEIVEESKVRGGKYKRAWEKVYFPPRSLLSFKLFLMGNKYVEGKKT